jgi:phospho-acceptor domain-containing protein
MLDRLRWRLTMGYVVIFALVLLLLGTATVVGFSREMIDQQDILLEQEAKDQAKNLLDGENREVLAEGSAEYSWVALDPEGHVTDRDPTAATMGTLGLPSRKLADQALEEQQTVSATIRGPQGGARVVSLPMREDSGEIVGVVQYARSVGGVQQTTGRLVLVLLPVALGGLGAALFGGLFMAGRAVRPARESFERQRAFVADASHELKTPLTLIRADAEVLMYRGRLHEEDEELVEHALAETDRMGAVLSDLLLVARLDAGKLDVTEKPFDLALVRGAGGRQGREAGGRNLGRTSGQRRPQEDRPDPRRPPRQRRQVRTRGRPDRRHGQIEGPPDRGERDGHGARHRARAPPPRLRPLLPGRERAHPARGGRGHRPGPCHRPRPRPRPGRRPHGRKGGGLGGGIPPQPSPGVSEPYRAKGPRFSSARQRERD